MTALGTTFPATSSLPPGEGADTPRAARRSWWTSRRVLVCALASSLAVHLALSLWPVEIGTTPETQPLQATLTELPPPPKPAPVAAPPKPKRAIARPAPVTAPEPAPVAANETPATEAAPDTAAREAAAEAVAPTDVAAAPPEIAAAPEPTTPEPPPKQLPPRVDLAYKVFLGTQGFMIGDATYRFEHTGNQYRMETVGQARGLAALLIRGQGRIESRGLITATGLQPQEFAVERGSREKREVAYFDWETGVVTLHEQKTAALELPTFDPLAVMWQFYFSPPTGDELTFTVATTRRVNRYTITRQGDEKIAWANGEIDTERWHRRSDDGKTDGYIWLAPSLHYVPVKMRLVATNRGTVEALLDSIRVDEAAAEQ
jgi:hypothetical protein